MFEGSQGSGQRFQNHKQQKIRNVASIRTEHSRLVRHGLADAEKQTQNVFSVLSVAKMVQYLS